MKRRELLTFAAMGATSYAFHRAGVFTLSQQANASKPSSSRFSEQWLQQHALSLAKRKYKRPKSRLPSNYKNMGYDQYRDVQFNASKAIWKDKNAPFQLQMFHTGFLYKHDVDIHLIERNIARKLNYSTKYFTYGNMEPPTPKSKGGFSGFRIHSKINSQKFLDEFCLFQGASYFRAVAAGQAYGLSARGLAINTGQRQGEEFPAFTSFWIEQPRRNSTDITLYGLLDSESVVGIYKFRVRPGNETLMDIQATLYPRKKINYVGIAPLTSMFMHGPASRRQFEDFRPRVHDSEGLCILNGQDELIWRPLINPKNLQFTSFVDENPKGFGLIQRKRNFEDYQDLEADYERRPSLWVEPQGKWGKGIVQLIEIPTSLEIHDNIVAFWKPEAPLNPGQMYQYNYSLRWGVGPDINKDKAYVYQSRQGISLNSRKRLFVIDYKLPTGEMLKFQKDMTAEVIPSNGKVSSIVLRENKEIGGIRLTFEFVPETTKPVDLRGTLKQNDKPISEIWVHRWEA